jgi:GNAT superfamily N-acetyltransferase
MSSEASVVTVHMMREHMDDIPAWPVPAGIGLRWYRKGDETAWAAIHRQSGGYPDFDEQEFVRSFGDDADDLARRMCFLVDAGGHDIATATAWYGDDDPGRDWGRIHWVAMVKDMQGKGLAKPLLSAVLRRLRDLGHRRAYLVTQSFRVPAISLYLSCGFVPRILGEADRGEWERLGRDGLPV